MAPTPRGLITENLTLLLLDPVTGRAMVDANTLDRAVGGALLLDLAARGRLDATGAAKDVLLTVRGDRPDGDPLLDEALTRLRGRTWRPRSAVERLARRLREPVLDRIVAHGWVTRERARLLGVLPVTVWRPADRTQLDRLRRRVDAVLTRGSTPDQQLAGIVGLLSAVRVEFRVVDGPRKQLRARAQDVAAGDWTEPGVDAAARELVAGVVAAVAVAARVGSTGAS